MESAPAVSPAATGDEDPGAAQELTDVRIAAGLVAVLVALIPVATAFLVWSTPGGIDDWNRRITGAPFDFVLIAALVWVSQRPRLLLDLFRSPAVRIASTVFAGWFLVSLAMNFSLLGVALGSRLLAGLCVIALASQAVSAPTTRRFTLGAISVVGALQAALAMVQAARGEAFGIEYLDFGGPLYPFGSSLAGRGGLTHPYHLAVFLVMCQGAALLGLRDRMQQRPATEPGWRAGLPWLAAMAVMGAGIGVTYTRAGALGQIALLAVLVIGRQERPTRWLAAGAIALGLAVGGLGFGDGWLAKGEATTGREAGVSADSNRSVRLREAKELISDHPVAGVGPGRYVEALAETPREEYLPAHNLLAHEAAELGVIGGLAALALLGLLALKAWRGGAFTLALVVPMVPFLLLDAYPYVFATGLATAAVWLGLVRAAPALAPDGAGPDGAAP